MGVGGRTEVVKVGGWEEEMMGRERVRWSMDSSKRAAFIRVPQCIL